MLIKRVVDDANKSADDAHWELQQMEEKYKAQLLAAYDKSEDKTVKKFDTLPGGSVAINKKFEYDDGKIIKWLKDHNFSDMVSESYSKTEVKKKHSEKHPVDGITVTENPVAKIDTDLSRFL
jgi:predicted mannosyl-3-phosphoglycerate phosphatase (HAD superfamily)